MGSTVSDIRQNLSTLETLLEVREKLDQSWGNDDAYGHHRFDIHAAFMRQATNLKTNAKSLVDSTKDLEIAGLVKRIMDVMTRAKDGKMAYDDVRAAFKIFLGRL